MMITTGIIKSIGDKYGFVHKLAQSPKGWDGKSDFRFEIKGMGRKFFLQGMGVIVIPYRKDRDLKWRVALVIPKWIARILAWVIAFSILFLAY